MIYIVKKMAPGKRVVLNSCSTCSSKITKYEDSVKCAECSRIFHLGCANLRIDDFQKMNELDTLKTWLCVECNGAMDGSRGQVLSPAVDVDTACVVNPAIDRIMSELAFIKSNIGVPCQCSGLLRDLIEENKKLQAEIKSQRSVIIGMRTDFGNQLKTISALLPRQKDIKVATLEDTDSVELLGENIPKPLQVTRVTKHRIESGGSTDMASAGGVGCSTRLPSRLNAQTKPCESNNIFTMSQVSRAIDIAKNSTDGPLVDPGQTWQVAKKRKLKRKPVIGSTTSETIKSVQRLGYLHVYRLALNTTADDLKAFLVRTAPDIEFDCRPLNSTDRSTSFRVSFPIQHVKEVYNPSLWPSGAHVNRFYFPRTSNRQGTTTVNGLAPNFSPTASGTQSI